MRRNREKRDEVDDGVFGVLACTRMSILQYILRKFCRHRHWKCVRHRVVSMHADCSPECDIWTKECENLIQCRCGRTEYASFQVRWVVFNPEPHD